METTQEIDSMTAEQIEQRLSANENDDKEQVAKPENNGDITADDTKLEGTETKEEEPSTADKLFDVSSKLRAELPKSNNNDFAITEEMLANDPLGTIKKLVEDVSAKKALELIEKAFSPFKEDWAANRADKAYGEFVTELKDSGISIDEKFEKAMVAEILKAPKMESPKETLQWAYFKVSKSIKPVITKDEQVTRVPHAESAARSRTQAAPIDANKMSIEELEKRLGFADE
jgi:hypothetical protein